MCDHMFVVTGGPSSGKSTLIDALHGKGFASMPEAGRAIIRDQVRIDGTALPWADKAMFAELMLGWELRSWHEASALEKPVLMDRGIPDSSRYPASTGCSHPTVGTGRWSRRQNGAGATRSGWLMNRQHQHNGERR